MSDINGADEERSRLIAELEALRKEVSELRKQRAPNREDRLKLAITDRMPMTLWACNRKLEIVLWSGECEQVYGQTNASALGRSFVDLFVDEPEKEAAAKDALDIVDNDTVFSNFLAYDRASNRQRRVMLTNCFRIWDEDTGEWLQAEVGLEISDLELRKDEHKDLREVGQERLRQQVQIVQLQKLKLSLQLDEIYSRKAARIDGEQRRLDQWSENVGNRRKGDSAASVKEARRRIASARASLDRRRGQLAQRIDRVREVSQLAGVQGALDAFRGEANVI